MKRKLIIICLWYVIINLIGCHPTDIFIRTKILSVNILNGAFYENNAIETSRELLPAKQFCLILDLRYIDSTVSKTTLNKRAASISLINSCYAAYDPPITPHYELMDSLISFSIIAMKNMSKEIREGDTVNNFFVACYSEDKYKNDSISSLVQIKQSPFFKAINYSLKAKYSHYNYPVYKMVFIPKIKIESSNQQFKICSKFISGKVEIDSTKTITINDP